MSRLKTVGFSETFKLQVIVHKHDKQDTIRRLKLYDFEHTVEKNGLSDVYFLFTIKTSFNMAHLLHWAITETVLNV